MPVDTAGFAEKSRTRLAMPLSIADAVTDDPMKPTSTRPAETPVFEGKTGKLYIRQPKTTLDGWLDNVTVYPSVESYNQRDISGLTFCTISEALEDFGRALTIDPETRLIDASAS